MTRRKQAPIIVLTISLVAATVVAAVLNLWAILAIAVGAVIGGTLGRRRARRLR